MYHYHAFNLKISSELPFPELLPHASDSYSHSNQIIIKFGKVSAEEKFKITPEQMKEINRLALMGV